MPTKSKAMRWIRRSLEEIDQLMDLGSRSADFIKWRRNSSVAIANTFGNDSQHKRDFDEIGYDPVVYFSNMEDSHFSGPYRGGLIQAKAILESMLEEIEEYWADDSQPQLVPGTQEVPEQRVSNQVFVVHGRDGGTRDIVARFLESLELEAVILQEQPNEGRTIIQKFEDHSGVGFAVVLCTPDDVGGLYSEQDKLRPRPRQNVILELGFFWGKLGRKKVCALLEGDMDMPSDFGGVLYIPLDVSEGWKLTLARELRAAGMSIDLNRIV